MKNKISKLSLMAVLVLLALSLVAFAPARPALQSSDGDQVVFGDNYSLDAGDTLNGDLVVLGGNADLAEGSTVTGDVVVLGGNLSANGAILGDVTAIGGLVTLGSTSVISGNVNALTANLSREEGSQIEGDINNDVRIPFLFSAPAAIQIPNWNGELPGPIHIPAPNGLDLGMQMVGGFLWWLGRSFMWALLALLATLFLPVHIDRIASAAVREPVPAGGLGLLTMIVGPLLLFLLALTICGIPITLIGALLLTLAWGLGVIALGLETGARLERLVHQDWAPSVQAAVGAFFLTLVVNGIGWLIPCIGWVIPFAVGLVGLGATLLTRFGSQAYPPAAGAVIVNAPARQPWC